VGIERAFAKPWGSKVHGAQTLRQQDGVTDGGCGVRHAAREDSRSSRTRDTYGARHYVQPTLRTLGALV